MKLSGDGKPLEVVSGESPDMYTLLDANYNPYKRIFGALNPTRPEFIN